MGGQLGVCLGRPITDKRNEHGEGNGLRFAVSAMQGWRATMEDTHVALADLPDLPGWSFFGVFDGHAGAGVSAHCAAHLLRVVLETEQFAAGLVPDALREGFLRLDAQMRAEPELASAGGSTAVCALVSETRVFLANCGDSRAVLSRGGEPATATADHKPSRPDEAERIRRAGGAVLLNRLNGTLAVSRALGDFDYKAKRSLGPCDQLVSPEPEVLCWERDETADEFLLLACDGVWDVMCNKDACVYVHELLKITDDLREITDRLIDTCLSKGSDDNMSVVLVTFPGAPKPTPEAKKADLQLEETIRNCIAEMIHSGERIKKSIYKQLHTLPNFLPGGGIHDKWTLIQNTMDELGLKSDDDSMSECN